MLTTGYIHMVVSVPHANLSSSFVPSLHKLYPGRCTSTGKTSTVLLIKVGNDEATPGTTLLSSLPTKPRPFLAYRHDARFQIRFDWERDLQSSVNCSLVQLVELLSNLFIIRLNSALSLMSTNVRVSSL